MTLQDIRRRTDSLLADYRLAKRNATQQEDALSTAREKVEAAEDAHTLVLSVAGAIQERAHKQIASVVSRCLESVFEEPYTFKIIFERKRGQTEARLAFERDGLEVDPLTASGGGVVDVAAFALRLACLILSRPPTRRLLVLDEPFKFVSAEYLPNVRELLLTLSKEMKVQFLMVTHLDALKIGKVVEL